MEALQKDSESDGSSLLDALVSALVDPVPFGPDGENERDAEFQENVVRLVTNLSPSVHSLISMYPDYFTRIWYCATVDSPMRKNAVFVLSSVTLHLQATCSTLTEKNLTLSRLPFHDWPQRAERGTI